MYVSDEVLEELKEMIKSSNIMKYSDDKWDEPDENGKLVLEIDYEGVYKRFITRKILSYSQVEKSKDIDGMECIYYLIQDLKCLVFSLMSLNFRTKPV